MTLDAHVLAPADPVVHLPTEQKNLAVSISDLASRRSNGATKLIKNEESCPDMLYELVNGVADDA